MRYIASILILFLVAVIILQQQCNHQPPPVAQTDTLIFTITTYDTIFLKDTIYKPTIVFRDTGSIIILPIDTLAILKDYFTKYFYSDTLLNDSSALIVINDTITTNRIISRSPAIKIYQPTTHITQSIQQPPKLHFSGGFMIGGNLNTFSFGPSLLLNTKRKSSYALSYDLLNKQINFSLYWQIF